MTMRVVFSRKVSWWAIGSRFICWAQGVPFSHVAIMLDSDKSTEPMIFEAVYPKSRKIRFTDWVLAGNIEAITFDMPALPDADLRRVLYENLDKDYSIIALAEQGVAIIFRGLKHKFDKLQWRSENYLICTEYAQRVFALYGVNKPGMSLRDVYRECRRINKLSE